MAVKLHRCLEGSAYRADSKMEERIRSGKLFEGHSAAPPPG